MKVSKKEKAIRVSTLFKDFNGDVQAWKDSFYELWRYQMTWDFAYDINLIDTRSGGVRLTIVTKSVYKDQLVETMTDLGYGNIKTADEYIGIVYGGDLPNDLNRIEIDW